MTGTAVSFGALLVLITVAAWCCTDIIAREYGKTAAPLMVWVCAAILSVVAFMVVWSMVCVLTIAITRSVLRTISEEHAKVGDDAKTSN
jgi:uncharacterized PurR-regulated membrane protein YhhQ (DUF165 family)